MLNMNIVRVYNSHLIRICPLMLPVNQAIIQKQFSTSPLQVSSSEGFLKIHKNCSHISKTYISSVEEKVVRTEEKPSILTRILKKIPFVNVDKARLNASAFILYESVADKINYADFFDEFALQDTFYSWFAVTELHIWMLSVRCMAEGDDGRYVRNMMIQAMWSDVGQRAKKIGVMNPSGTRLQIQELSEQFQAALIAYDEGLQMNDVVLAGALWRRLYQQKDADPEHLDELVQYIRRQVTILDSLSKESLFSQKQIPWTPIIENT